MTNRKPIRVRINPRTSRKVQETDGRVAVIWEQDSSGEYRVNVLVSSEDEQGFPSVVLSLSLSTSDANRIGNEIVNKGIDADTAFHLAKPKPRSILEPVPDGPSFVDWARGDRDDD